MVQKKKSTKKIAPKKAEVETKREVTSSKHSCDWKCDVNIENQIRIIMGSTILLCVFLGYMLSEFFFFLAGIVGFGLIITGAFDFCLLRTWLQGCSWNKEHKKKDKQ